MFFKLEIKGMIEVVTGMHIGGSSAFAAIGAVDSPIMRDAITNFPMIPGSSLKGKMRTLLAKKYNKDIVDKPDKDDERLVRLFGSAEKGKIRRSRVLISDMILSNHEELKRKGLQCMTEVKFENTINRMTAVANPRQIERSVRGSKYAMSIIYDYYEPDNADINEIKEDIGILADGMKLLQYDYLGGNGSRGYGKIKFSDLSITPVIGEVPDEIIASCEEKLKDI